MENRWNESDRIDIMIFSGSGDRFLWRIHGGGIISYLFESNVNIV